MSKIQERKAGRVAALSYATLLVIVFYVATVGLVPAVERHATDGRLQGLKSIPGVMTFLQAYKWPASRLAKMAFMRELFELSAGFWCIITNAPETT